MYRKVSIVALALAGLGSPLRSQTVQQIARTAFPSVVLLALQDTSGQPVSLGSGFFVADNLIATNIHVIVGASSGYAKVVGHGEKYNLAGIVAKDDAHDLTILAISGSTAPALPLGDSAQASIGDEVYVVGNPLGLEGTFSTGTVELDVEHSVLYN